RAELLAVLAEERVEKGNLVAAVDEMLALQQTDNAGASNQAAIADLRKSIGRPSGLKAPLAGHAAVESRIGRAGAGVVGVRSSGIGKSRMMSQIERMGRGLGGE
ncbi:hypothetical protein LTR66_007327, partial [Elasticomyces elasticus]